jgi:hypothetical protein
MPTGNERGTRGNKNLGKQYGQQTRFAKDNQPPPENKAAGQLKAKQGQALALAILKMKYKGPKGGELGKLMAEYFDVPESEITVEMMMDFRQIEKAIAKNDTNAWSAMKSRAFGQPKQPIEHGGDTDFLSLLMKTSKRK